MSNFASITLRVATREGGVDRNSPFVDDLVFDGVATREGGVDRNTLVDADTVRNLVATREGGVDRNKNDTVSLCPCITSPPARVAWIETRG